MNDFFTPWDQAPLQLVKGRKVGTFLLIERSKKRKKQDSQGGRVGGDGTGKSRKSTAEALDGGQGEGGGKFSRSSTVKRTTTFLDGGRTVGVKTSETLGKKKCQL